MSTTDSNQVVLLAGVTGQLGTAFARRVLADGHRLAAAVRRPWQVDKVRERFADVGAERLLVGVVGAQDSEAAAGFVKGCNDALGPLTAVVSTAGAFRTAAVGQEPAGELAELVEANLLSGATLVRAALPGMRRRGRGTITFVGSAAVGVGKDVAANYLASKAAVHEYVRALDASFAGSELRASVLVADTLDTEARIAVAVEELMAAAFGSRPGSGPLLPFPASD